MNKISFLSGNMDNANLEMVIKNDISDGIVIRSTEGFSDKGEEISTTEYFLDVQDQSVNEENADAQFLSVETSSEDNGNNQFIAVEVEDSGEIILHNKNVIIWSDICRICANGSDQFIPIFNGEGLENDLSNKINNYLPLKVSEDDNFPHQVCYSCAATLIAWHDMLTGCLEAQQQLQELQTKINLKDQLYNDTATEEDNIQSVTEIDTVTIEDKKINLKEDSSMETIQSIDAIESDRSKSLQNVSTNFKKFQRTFKHTLPPAKSSKISRNQSQSIKREVTRAVNKKRLQKVMKIEVTEVKTINSLINEEEFYESENSNFDSVKLKAAPSNDTEKSDNDSLEENAVSSSDSSESKKSDNSKYKKVRRLAITPGVECSHCGKKFRQYNSYQIHMRIHTGEKPYTCHICGKQFGQGGSLYYHLKHVHGGVKNHACDICGRCFAMKTAMEDHRRIHTGERPYVCDSCGKTFKTKASLYIHSKIHTDEYPFKCEYCKKLFRWKQQMISHLTTHTGEKNHICDICGKAFGVKNELTRHRRTHSLDKPFTCQKCGVSFGQKRYLTNHNRTRHRINASSSN